MFQRFLKKITFVGATLLAIISLSGVFAQATHAATLSINPATANVSVGNIISLSILVNANGTAINTGGATVHFPSDLLEVMSISKSSSIFSLWVQDPVFSNTDGTIAFVGGLPTPGFSGQSGQLISIVFRAKKQGTASIVMSDASVLANDGLGTNVLSAYGSASIQIGTSAEVPVVAPSSSLPPLPIITSTTNPDQNQWYSATSASFSWVVPGGVSSIQTLLSKKSDTTPTITYDNSVSQRTVDTIADGVLYFRLRYVNSIGSGPSATYKIQIDSTPPEKFTLNVQTQGLQNVVALNAVDVMSGIDSYSIQIDGQPSIKVQNSTLINNQYVLPTENVGQHKLVVMAYDKAGNHTESDTTFVSPAIVAPTISVSPIGANCEVATVGCADSIARGNAISVKGVSQYPHTPITVFVQPEGKNVKAYTTTTGADGSYSVVTDALDIAGPNSIWSQLIFSNTVQSPSSDKISINVADGLIVQTSKSVIYGLTFTIPAIVLAILLLYLLYLGWHEFFGMKRRITSEVQDAAEDAHKALVLFKDELENQLDKLKKTKEDRDLNRKEEKIFKELRNNIESIDEVIEKKIKKIK